MAKITSIINDLSHVLLGEKDPLNSDQNVLDNYVLLEKAKQEWQAALSFFNNVTEENQIDRAIYRLNAAEKYYGYMLQQVKKDHWYNRTVKKEV